MNLNNWPAWIPYPKAWLNALLLVLLIRGMTVALQSLPRLGEILAPLPPRFFVIIFLVFALLPIGLIAIVHHVLHWVMDWFSPNTVAPEMGKTEGLVPGLMSWWEGLLAWLAISLGLLTSFAFLLFYRPSLFYYGWENELRTLLAPEQWVRLVTIAYFYQIEHFVKQRLMSVGTSQ